MGIRYCALKGIDKMDKSDICLKCYSYYVDLETRYCPKCGYVNELETNLIDKQTNKALCQDLFEPSRVTACMVLGEGKGKKSL